MDTPDKTHIAATSSLSKFEDSPVFNYINSLSPIDPVKFVQTDHSFNSLSFTSPSSVFASPQIISHRESRLKSILSPDPLKPELPLYANGNKTSKTDSETIRVSDQCAEQLGVLTPRSSARGVTAELPNTIKCDFGSPASNWVSSDLIETSRVREGGGVPSSFAQSSKVNLRERQHFKNEVNLREICRIEQTEEAAGLDWVSLVSDVDVLDSFNIENNSEEEQDQETVDPGTITFVSTVLQLPQDNATDLENLVSISPSGSCKLSEIREPITQSGEIEDLQDKDQAHDILSSSLQKKLVVTESRAKVDEKGEKRGQSNSKHKIRRRCLVFETGSHKKCSSLIPSQTDCEVAHEENCLVPSKSSGHSLSMLPGVGLHLNAVAATSKNGRFVKCKTLASGRQIICMRSSMSSDSLASSQNTLIGSSALNSMEKVSDPCDNKIKVVENALQTSVSVGREEDDQNSPRKKRFKQELVGESQACKRCNCKRSKCLKLYCECFAAGLYCVEPCSCLDCFNKPKHEDTVLETRRLIESRNPLAFAPKVIRSADSATEFGDETNKTPASARHKRGCNCRRSSCLKKYCECFQGGVGCSASCRCEGCQNAFGRKDGFEETEYKVEESEAYENNDSSDTIKKDEDEHSDVLLIPPSIISRFSRGKRLGSSLLDVGPSPMLCTGLKPKTFDISDQPNFQIRLQVIPEDETPQNRKSNCSPTSPNSKRLSPPHHDIRSSSSTSSSSTSRKLILRSIRPLPSVTPLQEQQ
ncbi:hypothetical protein Dsin_024022 [Dipteronia sinensis]|uniref:CRC domain-containing protein n=1 Tax=Dipteronia sinensis TaxID=43782 RepID=A0AAE0E2N0_9ROSI|nr:hypothetical protein Dsin_024022 [Dipteronia sinensis]